MVGSYVSMGNFSGYWAEFEGDEVSSYEAEGIVYTLYRCTAYNFEAYRVHISDEADPQAPVYELRPYDKDSRIQSARHDYTEPYAAEQIAANYPLFLKDMDYLRTFPIDPS